jgi:hypothetical protein
MSDEELLSIASRICHFLMRHYISTRGWFHIPDGHMTQFPTLCDYIDQGRAHQAETNKKFKQICGCEYMCQLVYRKVVLCMKHVWCSMMNTCLREHVFGNVFNQFLSMCLMIIA